MALALAALAKPDVVQRLTDGAMQPLSSNPGNRAVHLPHELQKWGGLIRARGVRLG